VILLDPHAFPVIAHRGASGEWPENTMLAFARALELGADALECDVRLSADGEPVIIHDETLDRTTSGQGPVGTHTLKQLRGFDAGKGERIPVLEDVLDRFPETPLVLELKESRAGPVVQRVLTRHSAQRRVMVGAFAFSALRSLGHPFVRSAARPEVAWFVAAARLRLPLFRPGYQAFTVPERSGGITVVDRSFTARARRLGLPVHVWTVDDIEQGARLRALGVCGLITNFPGRFRAAGHDPGGGHAAA
jgi:glycerophosphoryl diester phosphodiesterase